MTAVRVEFDAARRGGNSLSTVLDEGCCVGCGACAVVAPDEITMNFTSMGTYEPMAIDGTALSALDDITAERAALVCPFADESPDEDALSLERFGPLPSSGAIGSYRSIHAGHVLAGDFRERGTSGGMITWVLAQLLERGEIDGVVHVGSDRVGTSDEVPPGAYSSYVISASIDEVMGRRKSRYHPQSLDRVMADLRTRSGRYAVVGVPCFVTATHHLRRQDPALAERIVFTVALVCGHLKSARFSDYLAWHSAIRPGALDEIDYRHKVEDRPANRYAISVRSGDQSSVRGVETIPMSDWGIGLFKLGACDVCDDVVGETADLSCGDAWLPPFMSDWRGDNLVITRSELAEQIVADGQSSGQLELIDWTVEQAAASQASGLRHRREGLAVRLAARQRDGRWAPSKRVAPDHVALRSDYGSMIQLREQIALTSHAAFARAVAHDDLGAFDVEMRPLVSRYHGSRSKTAVRSWGARVLHRTPPWLERSIRRLTGGRRFS